MATNYIQPGDRITVTAPDGTDDEAVASGAGLLVGSLFGFCIHDAEPGEDVTIQTTGVWSHAKAGTQAWSVGDRIYWDDSAKVLTSTASSHKLVGVAVEAVAGGAGDTIGKVYLTAAFTI
jgi:predicted RecA/RadA family phage recombinase